MTVRLARRLALAGGLGFCLCGPAFSQPSPAPSLGDAVRFLAHEKSAAEQYAVILTTVARNDAGQYVQGIRLYSDAKAEFDGLIAEIRLDLRTGQDPLRSEKFRDALQAAAEKRVAFTAFVSGLVDRTQGARAGLPDIITVVPDLVKAITDAGLAIWKAFRDAGKERRDAILDELQHLEWRSFGEVTK